MKTCIRCKVTKSLDEFTNEKATSDGKAYWCRQCFSDYRSANREKYSKQIVQIHRKRRHERYAKVRTIKSNPCLDCGKSFPYYVMDFDHRDPSQKSGDVSAMVKTLTSWNRIREEIGKCDLVCVCCHRLRTYKGQSRYKTRRFEHHKTILDILKSSTSCLDCKSMFQPCQMDFDHVDPSTKTANITYDIPSEILIAEIGKCHLVCANCHRERTQSGIRPDAHEHSAEVVSLFRSLLETTTFPEDRRFVKFPMPHLLGKVPDKELAKMTGVSRAMVAWYRQKSGIVMDRRGNVISSPSAGGA